MKGEYFKATLGGVVDSKSPNMPNELAGFSNLVSYGFQPHRVALWIYWHALLLLRKGVPFYSPPPANAYHAAEREAEHPKTADGCSFKWRAATGWPWKS